MSHLRIYLFGNFRVFQHDHGHEIKTTRSVQVLLAYLLLNRARVHSREVLSTLFWSDQTRERARACLNTALWRLRCILEPKGIKKGSYLIKSSSHEIGFNCDSDYWLDIATFEYKAHESLKKSVDSVSINAVNELEGALKLYSGGLLEGFYEDWTLNNRLHLQNTYMRSLEWLMQYYKHNVDYQSSILYAQKILEFDPLREDIHCEVMRMYMSAGQRTLALKQYERCRNVLASELGITPNGETQATYDAIGEATINGIVPNDSESKPVDLGEALSQLRGAMAHFNDAQSGLSRAIRLVEKFST